MNDVSALIDRIIERRKVLGLSQTQLSDRCGVKQPYIARMEKKVYYPNLQSLLRILGALGCELEIVAGGQSGREESN